jgi:hypothetical protein
MGFISMISICDHIHSLYARSLWVYGTIHTMAVYRIQRQRALQQSAYKGLKTTSDQFFPNATGGLRSRVHGPMSKNLDLRFQVLGPKSHPTF